MMGISLIMNMPPEVAEAHIATFGEDLANFMRAASVPEGSRAPSRPHF